MVGSWRTNWYTEGLESVNVILKMKKFTLFQRISLFMYVVFTYVIV